jgi:hypothetical protein
MTPAQTEFDHASVGWGSMSVDALRRRRTILRAIAAELPLDDLERRFVMITIEHKINTSEG